MNLNRMTRFILMSLVFSILCNSCRDEESEKISIVWKDNKAVQLRIHGKLVEGRGNVQVFVTPGDGPPILGETNILDEKIFFTPLIPFTRGFSYRVTIDGKLIDTIKISNPSPAEKTEVIAVHPSNGVVPENLLKMYIEFSKPMKEGESLQHIALIRNGTDTLSNVFLDLQPELWNSDRTILTVWLDPGRIKRDLQPNLRLGPPLAKNGHYTFLIKDDWEAADGSKLQKSFEQGYFTAMRDSICPDPSKWEIRTPGAGLTGALTIIFGESLDYMVAMNAIHILDKDSNQVPGKMTIDYPREDRLQFVPEQRWQKGDYTLLVDSKLEDIAGNNLDHPFDNDITQKKKTNSGEAYKRVIQIN